MNNKKVARELTRIARELSAVPRPWDERTVRAWEKKVRDALKETKVDLGEVGKIFGHVIAEANPAYGEKARALDKFMAAKHAALRLQSTVSDLVHAIEGTQIYVDMSMPIEASITAAVVRFQQRHPLFCHAPQMAADRATCYRRGPSTGSEQRPSDRQDRRLEPAQLRRRLSPRGWPS